MVLITYALSRSLNVHIQLSSGATSLTFGLQLHLIGYSVYGSSERSGQNAYFAACRWDKYQNYLRWLKSL